ncbi:hypothetical protein BDZ91DRAFT_687929 [Kalaharituber pfeilii]|nr:hypothetical protein BDZ91DRAFT_687929 [Kalaharituber pfeilii]
MDPLSIISVGSLRNVFGQPGQALSPIVVQCLQTKNLAGTPQAQERFRVVFSDTVHFVQCMLATQLNHYVKNGELVKGSLVKLKSYQANQVNQRRVLIIIDLEVLPGYGIHEKLGQPESLEKLLSAEEVPQHPVPTATTAAAPPATTSATAFYGNKPSAPSAPQTNQRFGESKRPSGTGNAYSHILPIEALNPYQNRWTIKARVTLKSDVKTYKNQRGSGKLFTVHFLDETGEIRATGFNDQCDALYDVIQEGQVYYVSKCRVVIAKKQFSNITNDYELTFERDTEIEKCEDQNDVPQLKFNFVPLAELSNIQKDGMVDVIGILREVGDVTKILSPKTNKEHKKREIVIADTSEYAVKLALWEANAQNFDAPLESVIAFKGVKVSDFNGCSLSMTMSSSMTIEPDIDDAYKLKGWYDAQGRSETFKSHQALSGIGHASGRPENFKNLEQVVQEKLGQGEVADYYSTKATIVYIKQDSFAYPACLSKECNKKVTQDGDDQWRCERCNVVHPRPQYRYIITISVNDAYHQAWFNCFDDVGRMIMGMSADELEALRTSENGDAFHAAFNEANGRTYIFWCRAKPDTYNETTRTRHQVLTASPPNYSAECAKLAQIIKLYA